MVFMGVHVLDAIFPGSCAYAPVAMRHAACGTWTRILRACLRAWAFGKVCGASRGRLRADLNTKAGVRPIEL